MKTKRAVLTVAVMSLVLSGAAFANPQTLSWYFASSAENLSAWGSLTVIPDASGTPGLYDITGGSGMAMQNNVTWAVTIEPCTNYSLTCTLTNTDGQGLNLQINNLLYLNHSVGSYLDDYGIALTPGPPGSGAGFINVYDGPSQFIYNYGPGGNGDLSHPFDIVPEPSSLTLLASGVIGLAGLVRRRMTR